MADNYVNKDNLKQTLEKLKGEIDKKGGTPHFKGTTAEVLAHYGVSSLDDIPEGNITTVTDIEPESQTIPIATVDTLGGIKVGDNLTITEDGVLSTNKTSISLEDGSSLYTKKVGSGYDVSSLTLNSEFHRASVDIGFVGTTDIGITTTTNNGDVNSVYWKSTSDINLDALSKNAITTTAITGSRDIKDQSVAHAATADSAVDDTKLPLTGGTITGDIKPDETGKYYVGTADNAFNGMYAKVIASRLNGGTYGSMNAVTEGTETTTGACRLTVGNSAASGTDKNAYGEIRLFNAGTNYVGLRTNNELTANRIIYLPVTSGTKTLAIDDEATTSTKGLMSAADKTKLDGIDSGANKVSLTTSGSGNAVTAISATNGALTVTKGTNFAARTGSASYDFNCKNLTVAGGTISVKNGDYIGYISQQGNQHILIKASAENYSVEFGVINNTSSSDKAWSFYPNTSDIVLGTASKRWGQIYSTKSTIATSDREEKKNITIIDKAKEFIMKLKPVSYMFNNATSDRHHYGFIAQDVEEAMNELDMTSLDFGGFCKDLKEDSDNEYIYGLRYEEFIAPLVATVQQQQKEIDGLKAEIEALKQNNINAM